MRCTAGRFVVALLTPVVLGGGSRLAAQAPTQGWLHVVWDGVATQDDPDGARFFLVDNLLVQVHKYNGHPIGVQLPPHVELAVTYTEPAVRGDTSSGSVTKAATLETGLEIRVPLFVKEGDRVKVHTETKEFAGRA